MPLTINEHVDQLRTAFRGLSKSRQGAIAREAAAFIRAHPDCADHSTFWRGLSARQVREEWHAVAKARPRG